MPSDIIKLQAGGRHKADELRKLSNRLKRGILTRAEFERQKAELLGRSRRTASSSTEDEMDVGESLIAEALAMLTEFEAPNLCAANVVSFGRREAQ
ncbi:SHOCT domain-containing protein [Methyloferula stellata]|uniref:SHOCT domain-containing protein n=1 Tax=Methyloferula stellata TaxID=876270 RepID=UPI0013758450